MDSRGRDTEQSVPTPVAATAQVNVYDASGQLIPRDGSVTNLDGSVIEEEDEDEDFDAGEED